jgi:hypothetical protein
MHYGPDSFGKDDGSGGRLQTLQSLIPLPSDVMGQRQGLSRIDIRAANGLANRAKGLIMPSGIRAHFEDGVDLFPDDGGALPDRVELASVDGDAFPDLVGFRPDPSDQSALGQVIVARGRADGTFGSTEIWNGAFCAARHACAIGDFNGDGLDDVVSYDSFNRDAVVSLSDGSSFQGSTLWQVTDYLPGADIRVGDVNGDCRDDLLVLDFIFSPTGNGTIRVHVGLSGGEGFGPIQFWQEVAGTDVIGVERFDGDAFADVLTVDEEGTVRAHLSVGSGLSNGGVVALKFCWAGTCKLADVNGDGRDDLLVERPAQHHSLLRLEVALNDGSVFRTDWTQYHELDCMSDGGCLYGDLDGDDDADAVEPLSNWDGSAPGSELHRVKNDTRLGTSVTVGITAACVAGPPPPSTSPWQQLSDFPADQVVGTRNQVYVRTGDQVLHHVWGEGWVAWPGSWKDVATTGDEVFGVSSSNYVYRADSDSQFTDLSNNMADAVAGVGGMLSVEASVGDLYAWDCFCGGNFRPGWTKLASTGPAWAYAMGAYPPSDDDVGRTPVLVRQAFTHVQLYDFWTDSWETIHPGYQTTGAIWAGGSKVYIRAWVTGDLLMWTGAKDASGAYIWKNLGPNAGVAVDPDTGEVYRLSTDKSRIERYDGGGQWTKVGGQADRIWVAGGQLIASSPASGSLFRLPLR